jgi:hypothetical protein
MGSACGCHVLSAEVAPRDLLGQLLGKRVRVPAVRAPSRTAGRALLLRRLEGARALRVCERGLSSRRCAARGRVPCRRPHTAARADRDRWR